MAENRQMTTIRLPPDLLEWAGEYAAAHRMSRTRLIEELLTALRENRLVVQPRPGPNPFPADELVISPSSNPALAASTGKVDA